MTVEALLPVIATQDQEVLNLDEEVFDFLGEMGLGFENNAIVAAPVSFPYPPSLQPTNSARVSITSATGQAVSPSASVSGQESGDDSSSVSNIPTVVTTSSAVQAAHLKNQKAATKPTKGAAPEDAVLQKKNRRRERNREHAKRCRSRKKDYLKSLEVSVVDLKQENEKLRHIMMMKFSPEEIASLMNAAPVMVPQPDTAPSSAANEYLQNLREGCGGMPL
ncbi:MAG: hypothetical protein SGILL_007942 [Bacillariaceae sp.]